MSNGRLSGGRLRGRIGLEAGGQGRGLVASTLLGGGGEGRKGGLLCFTAGLALKRSRKAGLGYWRNSSRRVAAWRLEKC
jgi:hypothetical protein